MAEEEEHAGVLATIMSNRMCISLETGEERTSFIFNIMRKLFVHSGVRTRLVFMQRVDNLQKVGQSLGKL